MARRLRGAGRKRAIDWEKCKGESNSRHPKGQPCPKCDRDENGDPPNIDEPSDEPSNAE